jgi:hypothetical protein
LRLVGNTGRAFVAEPLDFLPIQTSNLKGNKRAVPVKSDRLDREIGVRSFIIVFRLIVRAVREPPLLFLPNNAKIRDMNLVRCVEHLGKCWLCETG